MEYLGEGEYFQTVPGTGKETMLLKVSPLEDTIEISSWESFIRPSSSVCGVLSLYFPSWCAGNSIPLMKYYYGSYFSPHLGQ